MKGATRAKAEAEATISSRLLNQRIHLGGGLNGSREQTVGSLSREMDFCKQNCILTAGDTTQPREVG